MEPGKYEPTLMEVVEQLQAVLAGSISRESVADWAAAWVMLDNPTLEDDQVWTLLKQASGIDLKDSPTEYLHNEADIQSWIAPFAVQVEVGAAVA